MMRSRFRLAWALGLAGLFAVAVSPDAALAQRRPVRISSVAIAPSDAAVTVGRTIVFTTDAYDASNNPVATAVFTCQSSNPRVATVDDNCIATGIAPGTTIITARTGTGATAKSATATLTVNPAGLVEQQGANQPQAQPQPQAQAQPQVQPPVTAPTTRAATGLAAYDCQPAEGSGPAETLTLTPTRVMLIRGESRQLACRAIRADGELAARVPIVFSIMPGGERVIQVDSVGRIRAVGGDTGRAFVRAEVPGNGTVQPRQVPVEVRNDSVRFSRTNLWLSPGATDTILIEVPAQNRGVGLRSEFQFTSSDDQKVRVLPTQPIVSALSPGTARISGENGFYTILTTVNVHRRVGRFSATPTDTAITVAMRTRTPFQIRALGVGEDSAPVPEAPLGWVLPDTAFARFDTATRTLQATRTGETRLTVLAPYSRDSLVPRSWRIRVVPGGISASRTRLGLGVGERTPVAVRFVDERRQPIGPATGLSWRSTNDSVARYVDGQVVGVAVGRAQLTARTTWDSTVSVDVFVAGQLLASAQRGGRSDLFALTADSVPRFTPVTSDAAVELEPAWAPDLTRIAYVAAVPDRPTNLELFVANADGSEPRRLTFDSATVGAPVFVGPAGDRIVFQSNRASATGGRNAQLYVMNVDGTGRRQLTTGDAPNSAPDVSPDGSKVLFFSRRDAPPGGRRSDDIWTINMDGTGERRLTSSPRPEDTPLFAADGQSFYFLRDEDAPPNTKRVYRQSLTDTMAVAQAITPVGVFVRAFSVRPDGNLLALTRREQQRGAGDAILFFTPVGGTMVTVRLGAGEQLSSPVFRPATTQPR